MFDEGFFQQVALLGGELIEKLVRALGELQLHTRDRAIELSAPDEETTGYYKYPVPGGQMKIRFSWPEESGLHMLVDRDRDGCRFVRDGACCKPLMQSEENGSVVCV